MSENSCFFKLALGLKEKNHDRMVDFEKMLDDLCSARDENKTNEQRAIFALLKPSERRLNLLFKSEEALLKENALDRIQGFITTLVENYGWSSYVNEDGELFSVKNYRQIDEETARTLVKESRKKYSPLFDRFESEQFFGEDIFRGKKDEKRPKSNRFLRSMGVDDDEDEDQKPEVSMDEACEQLNSLLGLEEAKREISMVVKLIKIMSKENQPGPQQNKLFPYHYLVTADNYGVGMTTLLEKIAKIFCHLGIIPSPRVTEHFFSGREWLNPHRIEDQGLVAIHNIDIIENEDPEDVSRLIQLINRNKFERAIFFMTVTGQKREAVEHLREKLGQQLGLRTFHLPDYSHEQLTQIAEQMFSSFGMELQQNARENLLEYFALAQQHTALENTRGAKKAVEKLRFGKLEKLEQQESVEEKDYTVITKEEVHELVSGLQSKEQLDTQSGGAYQELDQIVGLDEVKNKIREICETIVINSRKAELGIIEKRPNLHMLFKGNPGTGKTTVARIVARILKEQGVLSKGGCIETSRDDLVSMYLGGTARKTTDLINKAYGCVLFIDEAYSLDGGHQRDYGLEALAVLVKQMEDKRDDLVVILAGYTKEMDDMLQINPGLKNRIAHHVEFPDYTGPDLTQILKKELGSEYCLEDGSYDLLLEFFEKASEQADRYFGNGRLARTLAERILTKQSLRLAQHDLNSKEDLQTILLEDVRKATQDKDIMPGDRPKGGGGGIGF